MSDPGNVERLAPIERRQVELELGVLDGVRGQHVRAERCHAPLEALAEVPYFAPVRAPRREVARQPVADVGEQPAAEELLGALVGGAAVGARVGSRTGLSVDSR